jgi:hypothetical protein
MQTSLITYYGGTGGRQMKRRLIAVFFALITIVCLFALVGCEDSHEEQTVLIIEGEPVSKLEYEYQLISVMKTYEYYGGRPIDWSTLIEGMEAEEYFREQAIESVLLLRAVKLNAERLDVSLTDKEYSQIKNTIDEQIKQAGGRRAFEKQLNENRLTQELYEDILSGPELYNKIFQYLYGEESDLFPDESRVLEYYRQSYVRTRHILFFLIDEEGIPLSIGDREERMRTMEGILSELRAGGDFEQLMLLYNEDTAINSASVCFSHGFMPENYYQAAVSLPRYGISDVIVLSNAICIINRLPLDDTYLNDNYDSIRLECAKYAFDSLLDEWKDDLKVECTPLYYDVDVQSLYSQHVAIKMPPGVIR